MPDPKGLVLSNSANDTRGKHVHSYSTFDESLSYRFANTLRFGDYTPSFDMEGVPNDEIQLNTVDRIDSLSLKAPFKGSIRKIKESFKVPYMAILPKNWDRIYAQNSNGDDVPADTNCIVEDWPSTCKSLFSNAFNLVKAQLSAWDTDPSGATFQTESVFYTALMRLLVLGEYMYSAGSLLHVSGYRFGAGAVEFSILDVDSSGDPDLAKTYITDYDGWFDAVISRLFKYVTDLTVSVPVGSSSVSYRFNGPNHSDSSWSSFRAFIELFRENPLTRVVDFNTDLDSYVDHASDLAYYTAATYQVFYQLPLFFLPPATEDQNDVTSLSQNTLNLSRLLAYQLVCAHFYTNSSIDFVYSAELYRQYLTTIYDQCGFINNQYNDIFNRYTWNGMSLEYDICSGHCLSQMLFYSGLSTYHFIVNNFASTIDCLGGDANSTQYHYYLYPLAAWSAIFGFRKSLRYGDYFTASRPRPLAPINTDVAVNNNMVSVVDITRNIQAQRFANSVMRSRSKIEEYVKSIFGKAPAPDFHNPFFLTRQTEMIFGDEVQNTAENTNISLPQSRTSNFTTNVGAYTFTFHNDDMHPCVYLQIISFDIRRAYTRSVDRQFLHRDRFDMFNPDFQFIGDQPVYGIELGYNDGTNSLPAIFSYQSRDMEYKQRFDVCSSGFLRNLPGWILTDMDRSKIDYHIPNLSPDFIRSYNTELDQFFLSLTGYSLGSYFHFICITQNNVNAKRAMAVDPQILA